MMPSGPRTSPPHRAAGRHVWHLKKDLRLCRKHIFNCSRITFSTPFWAGILLRQAVFSWGNSKSRAFTGSKNTTERLTSGTRNSSTLSDFPPATVSRKGHNHFTLSLKVFLRKWVSATVHAKLSAMVLGGYGWLHGHYYAVPKWLLTGLSRKSPTTGLDDILLQYMSVHLFSHKQCGMC